jgi:adenine-specific DNA-methyltransferase
LLRRFSAKEDERRLVAAPYLRDALPGPVLGLENHLNFIHSEGGELPPRLAVALAALLNSSLFDAYFRLSNGNTQVSATELRALPLPPPPRLAALGRRLQSGEPAPQAVRRWLAPVVSGPECGGKTLPSLSAWRNMRGSKKP